MTVVGALPVLSAARRAGLAALPRERRLHAALAGELPVLAAVELRQAPTPAALGPRARVVAWNAERCRHLDASAQWLAGIAPDVLLLSEMDQGMARSGQRHTARELALRLGCGYAFGVEFLELDEPADAIGHHGNAILSRAPLARPTLVRLDAGGDWFDGARGERRIGGRIAVLAQIELDGRPVSFAAVHLESHSDPAHRAAQLSALLAALDAYDPAAPALIGGDLNTFSLALAELGDAERVAAALAADPARWGHPVPHEPLFGAAEARGHAWREANLLGEATHRHPTASGSARGRMKLDWFLARDLAAESPRVLAALDATGGALSDHEAIAVEVRALARA